VRSAVLAALAAASLLAACTSTTGGSGTAASSSSVASSGSASVAPGELPAAAAIPGVRYHPEPDRTHATGVVRYDTSPPVGGRHSAYWADCTGTVYPQAIANENAVHMLEHGAVWVTYREGLDPAKVATLTSLVAGVDHTALSPYPGLMTNISLQSWGYQLFVDDPADPRIAAFLTLLRGNPATAPEPGASCSNPTFKTHPSTFGSPLEGP
jgi:hypothetical protein